MLVSDYRVFTTNEGDGIITFIQNNVINKVLIPKSNTIAKDIFDKYYDQLSYFKYRYYAIAKWIVQDIRKAGFIFKYLEDYPSIYIPIYTERNEPTSSETLSEQEKLYLFYYEMEFIKKKMSSIPLENEYQSI